MHKSKKIADILDIFKQTSHTETPMVAVNAAMECGGLIFVFSQERLIKCLERRLFFAVLNSREQFERGLRHVQLE